MPALFEHCFGHAGMNRRVDCLQSVTQYCNCRQSGRQGSPVCSDVNPVSKAADNQQPGEVLRQPGNDFLAQSAAVLSGMSCAYHAEYHR